VDGRLTDEAWLQAPVTNEFLQRDPDEGSPATEQTDLRVLYDDDAVYIGLRMFDRDVDRITRRMSRRDDRMPDADRITVFLDPRLDHLTGASFEVTAAGVQSDDLLYDDTRADGTWDAVWSSSVTVDDEGWTAEIKIPFSQLRFQASDQQTWGINVSRVIRRQNETAWLQLVPKEERGVVSRMAHLVGVDQVRPKPHLELLPYVSGRAEFIRPSSSADPFNDGSRAVGGAGFDIKRPLTSNLTLDGTMNPDFGQVELDPEVINLTAFETFFEERRPFFLEGGQILRNFGRGGGGGGGGGGNWGRGGGTPQIFYPRRIGRAPQGSTDADYVDKPTGTTILGAAKLTGKTSGGWSLGVLNAVTGRQFADLDTGGVRSRAEVEPLTNYFMSRLLREGARGGVGVIGTGVFRGLQTDALRDRLPNQATVFGADAYYFLDRQRQWLLGGQVSGSRVQGSAAAIERIQRFSSRYFQRPDAQPYRLDAARTSMGGWSANAAFARQSGNVLVNASFFAISPGFEVNDLGFQTSGDRFGGDVELNWRKLQPDKYTRRRDINFSRSWMRNFEGHTPGGDWSVNWGAEFLNYWNLEGSLRRGVRGLDDRLTRGGPVAVSPADWGWSLRGHSDSRQAVSFNANFSYTDDEMGGRRRQGNVSVSVKAGSRLTVSTGPQVSRSRTIAQYVTSATDAFATETYGMRYVFGDLDQTQVSLQTRLNLLLTPDVSLQMYMQPLVGVGSYRDLKEFAAPGTYDFSIYGRQAGAITYDPVDEGYIVDPDGTGPAGSFTFDDPSFNRKTLRLQTVFRWEWRPGSRLYVVWSQQRRDDAYPGQFDLGRDIGGAFTAPSDNVLAVKMTYWLGR
jgi:hypothetical protein